MHQNDHKNHKMAEAKEARAPKEAARNRLTSGYDENFVNGVEDDFQCLICHLALKEPVQTRCGHRCCKECLEEHFRRQEDGSQPYNCPADREGLDRDRDVFPDKAMERKILSFTIRCPSRHCDWTGELRNKEDHIVQCSKSLVTCPNKCGGSIARKLITNHTTKDCPLTLISCPYVEMGCKRKVQRKEVEFHLKSNMKPHLDLACVMLKETNVKLNSTEAKLNNTEAKLTNTEVKLNYTQVQLNTTAVKLNNTEVKLNETQDKLDTQVFIWKINNLSKILRQAKTGEKCAIFSPPFYTARAESYGYKLKVKVYLYGFGLGETTHLSVFIAVWKGKYDAILPWPFKKKVKFTLIDQQEDPVKRENVTMMFIPGNIPECFARPTKEVNTLSYGFHRFISHEKLRSRRYIVDDTLFLHVEVGPSS